MLLCHIDVTNCYNASDMRSPRYGPLRPEGTAQGSHDRAGHNVDSES